MKRSLALGAVAATVIASLGCSAPALAAKGGPAVSCTVALEPVGPVSLSGEIPTVPVYEGCVPGQTQIGDVANQPKAAAADQTIGIIWDGRDMTGSSLSFTAPTGCLNGSYQVGRIGGGWNNRARSAAGLHNCNTMRLWRFDNFQGTDINCGWQQWCATMGTLEDDASSIKWHV